MVKKLYFCADSEEEQIAWMKNMLLADTSRKNSSELDCYKELVRHQEEMIKKLQKGMSVLLDQKEQKFNLKRPNERFYKEYFFFLALSVKRNQSFMRRDTIDVQDLYDKAQKEHVPFHKWYVWIPQQIKLHLQQQLDLTTTMSSSPPKLSISSPELPIKDRRESTISPSSIDEPDLLLDDSTLSPPPYSQCSLCKNSYLMSATTFHIIEDRQYCENCFKESKKNYF